MAQSTTPPPTRNTVEVSKCQLAILNYFYPNNAQEMARMIRSVCTSAITSDCASYDDIATLMMFSEDVQQLADEHSDAAAEFYFQHNKLI